jgi:protein-arginine kinase
MLLISKIRKKFNILFNELNELMIFSLNSSPNNYHCITIFKFLYPNYLENNPNNNKLIINYFFYISKQMS